MQPALTSHMLLQPRQRQASNWRLVSTQTALSVSGTGEAFATIFFSELGDKSFFLTMLLAVRRGRAFALLSSQSALALMTGISASLGMMLRKVPKLAGGQMPLRVMAACLMFVFAAQTLTERNDVVAGSGSHPTVASSSKGVAGAPLAVPMMSASASKRPALVAVECGGEGQPECEIDYDYQAPWKLRSILKPAALIFLSEWGDRSMLATVTLAATRSPAGTFFGGILGHLGAGVLAVAGGGFLLNRISGRTLKTVTALLFAMFGVTTLLEVY